MSGLNGAAGTVFGAIGVASGVISTIGGILFAQVYRSQDTLDKRILEVREESKEARRELRADLEGVQQDLTR
jgi:C4-type Zn-finger protein